MRCGTSAAPARRRPRRRPVRRVAPGSSAPAGSRARPAVSNRARHRRGDPRRPRRDRARDRAGRARFSRRRHPAPPPAAGWRSRRRTARRREAGADGAGSSQPDPQVKSASAPTRTSTGWSTQSAGSGVSGSISTITSGVTPVEFKPSRSLAPAAATAPSGPGSKRSRAMRPPCVRASPLTRKLTRRPMSSSSSCRSGSAPARRA